MKMIITGRKIDITEGLRDAISKKLGKLSKFFSEEAEAIVTLSVNKERQTVEVTIHQSGMIYRAEDTSTDMYAAIDRVVDIIERQIRKNKTRLEKRMRDTVFTKAIMEMPESAEEETEFKIVKSKKHPIKPMSAEEAILQMNLLGHEFYIFKNAEDNETCIVYKRKDGNYGMIETKE